MDMDESPRQCVGHFHACILSSKYFLATLAAQLLHYHHMTAYRVGNL